MATSTSLGAEDTTAGLSRSICPLPVPRPHQNPTIPLGRPEDESNERRRFRASQVPGVAGSGRRRFRASQVPGVAGSGRCRFRASQVPGVPTTLSSRKDLIRKAEALDGKASSLRNPAYRRQNIEASVHDFQQHVPLLQQISPPSNLEQATFGASPTSMSGWPYHFDPSTIFRPDGTLLADWSHVQWKREFETWDLDMQHSHSPVQHGLDSSVSDPNYETQQQQASFQQGVLPGRSNSRLDSSASSARCTGLDRMQTIFYTQLEADRNAAAGRSVKARVKLEHVVLHHGIGL
ncbi:hypothetical protein LTR56_012634 [Elasticomyces elasticus]|nr:hypothetical protein LTR56_012634 [Elasticomyces elasticus]KAK4922801.1 hypothetical protein LTR49_009989 [Elasticomyces elasticus]KAK5769366.1 hypothetical protein LTS12_000293 [Elasticomyces elasticus]